MSKMVDCVVLGRQAPALETAPWPGDLGERIVQQVSLEGWQQWLARQTMLMNEKRLSPINPEHRAYRKGQMDACRCGDGGDTPEGGVAPETKKS